MMSALTPAMDTALAASNPLIFGALCINLPGYPLCLLDGPGSLTFSGLTFVGRDDTYGVLAAIDPPSDGMGDEAPALSISLNPPTASAAATLSAATMQGSRVRLWIGAVTRATGAVIADPYLLFDGVLDQPHLSVSQGERLLEYDCVSSFELMFDNDEGFRLSDANHQRVWPGEEGLEHMSGLVRKHYWGTKNPNGAGGTAFSGGGFRGILDLVRAARA